MSYPIIFLHGFPFDGSSWDPQLEHFKGKYQTFAPDLRGHGKGPAGPGPWMIAHYADDLKIYMDEMKIEKAFVCGLSMGGYIALHFTASYPERLAGLILCDTRADADSNEAKDKRYATIRKIHQEGTQQFATDFSKNALGETTRTVMPQIQEKVQSMILNNQPQNIAMVLGALASRRDSTPYLEAISCPTMILVGTEDKITPPDVNESLAKKIKGSSFHLIEKAGHLSNLEQPKVFNRYLEDFLKIHNR